MLASIVKKASAQAGVGLTMTEVPSDLLGSEELHLRQWSMLVTDQTLITLAKKNDAIHERKRELLRLSQTRMKVADIVSTSIKTDPVGGHNGVTLLDIHGAIKVTDFGLYTMGRICTTLRTLDLGGCVRITDAGVRAAIKDCSNLTSLSLSSIPGLKGHALEAVGACCPRLKAIHLANATWIKHWMMMKISMGCIHLEILNLNGVTHIKDDSIKIITHYCKKLRIIRLRQCYQLSDVSVLAISSNDTKLQELDVSRTQLGYKITDVALLSLAERCPGLNKLDLSGCDAITDVGISWLSSGCHALLNLNLNGCRLLTDTAMRSIAAGCPLLQVLNLKTLKHITDVGVRVLGQGCRALRTLDLSGLVFLTDGMKRDFAREGLQAMSEYCDNLRGLNLTGCFQVGGKVLKAISKGCPRLQNLNLCCCKSVNSKGLETLFSRCKDLRQVDLTLCTSAVTNRTLKVLARRCSSLTSLNLRGCDQVRSSGLKALLRGCPGLTRLNLSGCTHINDIALMALSEAKLTPGLSELDLSGLTQVSETGLSWLASNCPTLLSINLAGCDVNRKAIKTIRQSWKYVYMKSTNPDLPRPFFGLAPEPRARDLRKIDAFAVAWKAAVKVQCLFRQGQALRRVAQAKERKLMNWVATKWQSLWRRRLAKRAYFLLKWQRKKEELAAIVMQNVARKIRALRIVRQRKHELYLQKRLESAIFLQRRWRGKLSRDLYHLMLQAKRMWEQRAGKSAIVIQRRWRGLLGRKQYKLILAYKAIMERKQNRAATRVQTMLRGRLARKKADEKREAAFQHKLARQQGAVTIQSLYRMRAGYKARMQNIAIIAMRHQAATMLQSAYRGRASRLAMRRWREALEAQHRERAATALQAGLRMGAAMLKLKRLREAKRRREAAMARAVRMLQRVMRGIRGRQKAKSKQMDLLLDLAKQEQLDKWAVTKVQAVMRGRMGRKIAQAQRIAVAHYWRTIFDATETRNIYFNINTREVRMRKPQALLDLMPRIKCDNCNFYLATMECKHCTESFCDECWSSVHYGGKRKKHKFRALFDFYDKRIDYGDGEWPSKWPSDVVQDEFYGWSIREPNGRVPIEVGGWPWAKYLEDDQETEYYYNQKTEEIVYERPEGMDNHISAHQAAKVVAVDIEHTVWKKFFNEETGREFYLNPDTGDSTYIRPIEFETPREQREAEEHIQEFDEEQLAQEQRDAANADPSNWEPAFNEETGEQYYLNTVTGDTSAQPPEGYTEGGVRASATGPWQKYYDEDNASYFYYNNVTQESVFERPEEYLSPRQTAFETAATAPASAQQQVQPSWDGQPQLQNSQLLESGQNNWQKYWDDNQQEFYYNTATNESTYDRPRTYYTPRIEAGAGNWSKYWDEATHQEFYYNTETQVSQFERPLNFVTPRASEVY